MCNSTAKMLPPKAAFLCKFFLLQEFLRTTKIMKVNEKLQVDHRKLNRMYRSYQLSEAQSREIYCWDAIKRLMKKRLISQLKKTHDKLCNFFSFDYLVFFKDHLWPQSS